MGKQNKELKKKKKKKELKQGGKKRITNYMYL